MIKGVNRYVLEIPRPDSAYFEKAIFFVRPEHRADGEERLRSSALALMEETSSPPRIKKRRVKEIIVKILLFFFAAGSGAAAAAAIMGTVYNA